MRWLLALVLLTANPAWCGVTYSSCDLDADPTSCSAIEIADHDGSITVDGLELRERSAMHFIGSGDYDGNDAPDYAEVLVEGVSATDSAAFVWNDSGQHRADSLDADGNTYSHIEYPFEIFLPAGELIFSLGIVLDPNLFTNELGRVTALLQFAGEFLDVELFGTPAGAPNPTSGIVVLDFPVSGGDPKSVSGTVFDGALSMGAFLENCQVDDLCLAAINTVEIRFFLTDAVIFVDGFESGDLTSWAP